MPVLSEKLLTLIYRLEIYACAFSAALKRCTNNTPPLRAAGAVLVLAPAVARCTSRITIPATRFRQPASMFRKKHTRFGNTTTHCRTATAGNTRSTMCAAVSTIRRVLQLAHTPRPLHEYATKSPGRTSHSAPAQTRAPE